MVGFVTPQPLSYYAREVRRELPADAFAPHPLSLGWMAFHLAGLVGGMFAVAHHLGGWPGMLLCSIIIGHSFSGLGFCGHEILHGSVVRNSVLRQVLGFIAYTPFCLSPTMWVAWHNRVHHGNTQKVGVDPDMFPTLEEYRASKVTRIADAVSYGSSRLAGFFTILIGFTGQSTQVLFRQARKPDYLSASQHRRAIIEWVAMWSCWIAYGVIFGKMAFLFGFAIPLMIGNSISISYIYTNHNLSPFTEVNDPLINSLSVTFPRWVEKLHLNFGYHVEHHLFPSMSGKYGPAVRDILARKWPDRYQSMPFFRAMKLLYFTPRVYKDATTLIEPRTGLEFSTLVPTPSKSSSQIEGVSAVVAQAVG